MDDRYNDIILGDVLYNNIKGYKLVKIEVGLLEEIKGVADYINRYRKGFYFSIEKEPFLLKGSEFSIDGNEFTIGSIEDIVKYIDAGGYIRVNNELRLDKSNIRYLINLIYDSEVTTIYQPLLEDMLSYIESYILTTEHPELDIVISDVFNISDKVTLVNNLALKYESYIEYFADRYIDYANVVELVDVLYHRLYEFILMNIDINSLDMFKLSTELNVIKITYYNPPSSIRYSLNKMFLNIVNSDKIADEYIVSVEDMNKENIKKTYEDIEKRR